MNIYYLMKQVNEINEELAKYNLTLLVVHDNEKKELFEKYQLAQNVKVLRKKIKEILEIINI